MREIVLDTETTGLDWQQGDRIVEIGCLELVNHLPTGRVLHHYVNPQRAISAGAAGVHGITMEDLAGKPTFREVAQEILDFIEDAPLVIHNAAFDSGFLNNELNLVGMEPLPESRFVCTLVMARRKYPGAQNSLDALCRRFAVDSSARVLHGALLDAQLLAEVYLELIGGRQPALGLADLAAAREGASPVAARRRPVPLGPLITAAEAAAHQALVATLGENAVWALPGPK
jgi:DNA polymerase-3 subunit epsilon